MKRIGAIALAGAVFGMVVAHLVPLGQHGDQRLAASVALAQSSCSCPEKVCGNGTVKGCSVTCPAGQDPVCACDAFCDDSGNPGGLNRCACQ